MTKQHFLRRALLADAVISGVSALLFLFAADALSRMFDVPALLFRYAGVGLIPFTAFVAYLCTRDNPPRTAAWTVIALNVVWVLASILVLVTGDLDPNRLGVAFIVVQAIAVAVFAEVQYVGLRRA